MSTPSLNKIQVNLAALRYNYLQLQEKVGKDVQLLAVVKSNAYGHGLIAAAKAFSEVGAQAFGVAEVEEGVRLREAGITGNIVVLLGCRPSGFSDVLRHDLRPVVYQQEIVEGLSELAQRERKKVGVHVKLDVGMGRLGVRSHEFQGLLDIIEQLPGVYLCGLMSHLPMADNCDEAFTREHYKAFLDTVSVENRPQGQMVHIANSAALLRFPELRFDMVRPGITLYGCYPSGWLKEERAVQLKPAMSFKSCVIQVKDIPEGSGVSYGHSFVSARPTRLAVIPAGYDDGYSRRLSGKAEVLIRGQRVRVVGTICMNACMADVTDLPGVQAGDEVVLMGSQGKEEISADEIAGWLGTINYEVLCIFGACNRHEYVNS